MDLNAVAKVSWMCDVIIRFYIQTDVFGFVLGDWF